MKYGSNVYFNQNPLAMLNGYQEGDPLKPSVMVVFPTGADPAEAANVVFAELNKDTRPNGKIERSLSVGDVVRIVQLYGDTWLACEGIGWKEISNPFEKGNA